MLSKLRKDQKGFTIIEVLIVLAIAGLIMLIVFLAVPALQRNQRNNARNAEASRMSAGITECMANRNGSTATTGEGCGVPANIQYGNTQQLTALTYSATGAVTTSTTAAIYRFNAKCNDTASGISTVAADSSKQFVVVYRIEPAVERCIGSE